MGAALAIVAAVDGECMNGPGRVSWGGRGRGGSRGWIEEQIRKRPRERERKRGRL